MGPPYKCPSGMGGASHLFTFTLAAATRWHGVLLGLCVKLGKRMLILHRLTDICHVADAGASVPDDTTLVVVYGSRGNAVTL